MLELSIELNSISVDGNDRYMELRLNDWDACCVKRTGSGNTYIMQCENGMEIYSDIAGADLPIRNLVDGEAEQILSWARVRFAQLEFNVEKLFNINDKFFPFTERILDGEKTVETRESNSLRSLVGKRVGIVRTGKRKAELVGYVTITEVIRYDTEAEFRKDENRHLVEPGSRYDIGAKGKYGYVLANPVRCEPTRITALGNVIRNI